MKNASRAAVNVLTSLLTNVAAISIGIALYEKTWWAFTVATVALTFAVALAWRTEL